MTFESLGWSGWRNKMRSCAVHAAVTAGTLCGVARVGGGQVLAPGARVRVRIPAEADTPAYYLSGRLVRLKGDTVVISPENGVAVPITLNAEQHLQVRASSRGHGGTGAKLGLLLGGVTGWINGAAKWQPCKPAPGFLSFGCALHPSRGVEAGAGAILGAGGGALLGSVVGSFIRSETWISVRTEGVSIVLTPARVGIRVAL